MSERLFFPFWKLNKSLFSAKFFGFATTTAILLTASQNLYALPSTPSLQGGSATFSSTSNTYNVNNISNRAVIHWNTFNLGASDTVHFNFSGTDHSGIVLNKVITGTTSSAISGRIDSNGRVILINPNGLTFNAGSVVDVYGLIATTASMSSYTDFLNGSNQFNFDTASNANSALNRVTMSGAMTIEDGGWAALVAPIVNLTNTGTITIKAKPVGSAKIPGKLLYASARKAIVDFNGDGLISFLSTAPTTSWVRTNGSNGAMFNDSIFINGTIDAQEGGYVHVTADYFDTAIGSALNMSGTIQANSATQAGGTIILDNIGFVRSNGTSGAIKLSAKGDTHGGNITINGFSFALGGTTDPTVTPALLDVSSAHGDGGNVTIRMIDDPLETHTAANDAQGKFILANDAYIHADGGTAADGTGKGGTVTISGDGEVRLHSMQDRSSQPYNTSMASAITAKGGTLGGNGGNITLKANVSLPNVSTDTGALKIGNTVDTSAAHGTAGTVTLSETDFRIISGDENNRISATQMGQQMLLASQVNIEGVARMNISGAFSVGNSILYIKTPTLVLQAPISKNTNGQITGAVDQVNLSLDSTASNPLSKIPSLQTAANILKSGGLITLDSGSFLSNQGTILLSKNLTINGSASGTILDGTQFELATNGITLNNLKFTASIPSVASIQIDSGVTSASVINNSFTSGAGNSSPLYVSNLSTSAFDISNNIFDGVLLSSADRSTIESFESKVYHGFDDPHLGVLLPFDPAPSSTLLNTINQNTSTVAVITPASQETGTLVTISSPTPAAALDGIPANALTNTAALSPAEAAPAPGGVITMNNSSSTIFSNLAPAAKSGNHSSSVSPLASATVRGVSFSVALMAILTPVLKLLFSNPLMPVKLSFKLHLGLSRHKRQTIDLSRHVIICGLNQESKSLVHLLLHSASKYKYIALEANAASVHKAKRDGYSVKWGNPASIENLEACRVDRAAAVILMSDKAHLNERSAFLIHKKYPNVPIITHATDSNTKRKLLAAGARTVLPSTDSIGADLATVFLESHGISHEKVEYLKAKISHNRIFSRGERAPV